MNYLVVSCSLNPESKSKLLALSIKENVEFLDLAEKQIPFCDGDQVYSDPITAELGECISSADGIILCVPVYNYDVNAAAKNLIELTGRNWMSKVVGFACAAGGKGSYMSVMRILIPLSPCTIQMMPETRSSPNWYLRKAAAFPKKHWKDSSIRQERSMS